MFQGIEAPQPRQEHHKGTANDPPCGDQGPFAGVGNARQDLTNPGDLLSVG